MSDAQPEFTPRARVRRIREAKGWELTDVASRLGCVRSTVSKLETGRKKKLDLEELQAYADALEVPHAAVTSTTHDAEIDPIEKAVDFVTRHSLEAFARDNDVTPAEASSLRATYKKVRRGPRDVRTWQMTFAYAEGIAQVRKPGARVAARHPTSAQEQSSRSTAAPSPRLPQKRGRRT